MYSYLGTTNIPVTTYTAAVASHTSWTISAGSWTDTSNPPPFAALDTADFNNAAGTRPGVEETISMLVTFPVYVMALLGFVGWFFFVFFAGVGLASLPVDLICSYGELKDPRRGAEERSDELTSSLDELIGRIPSSSLRSSRNRTSLEVTARVMWARWARRRARKGVVERICRWPESFCERRACFRRGRMKRCHRTKRRHLKFSLSPSQVHPFEPSHPSSRRPKSSPPPPPHSPNDYSTDSSSS